VVVDDDGVREQATVGTGIVRSIAWSEVQRLSVVVRAPRGVPLPPVRWAFVVEDRAGVMVAVPSEQTEAVLARSHLLPGFDHDALRAALSDLAGARLERPGATRRERWRAAIVPTGSRRAVTLFRAEPGR
jgi:hypothetical protein